MDLRDPLWLTVLAIIATFVITAVATAYLVRREAHRLAYRSLNVRIVDTTSQRTPGMMEIRFSENVVPRVALSRVAVWNAGHKTIDGADLVRPITLEYTGDVLSAEIVGQTDDAIGASVLAIGSRSVSCGFQYLNQRDGFMVEIFHAGDAKEPAVSCSAKNLAKGPTNWGALAARSPTPVRTQFAKSWRSYLIVLGIVAAGSLGLAALGEDPYWQSALTISAVLGGYLGFMILAGAISRLLRSGRQVPAKLWQAYESSQAS